jgi:hypothetical protein
MDDPADVSCQNRPGWDLVDGCVSTCNPVPLFEVMASPHDLAQTR